MDIFPASHAPATGAAPILLPSSSVTQFKNTKIDDNWGAGLIVSAGASGGIFGVVWEFECPAGQYELWTQYVAAESRPMIVSIDGRMVVRNGLMEHGSQWLGEPPAWYYQAVLSLPAGRHTLALERDGFVPHVKAVALLPVTNVSAVQTVDQRYGELVEGRIAAFAPVDADDVLALVRHVTPMVRGLLNNKRDPDVINQIFQAHHPRHRRGHRPSPGPHRFRRADERPEDAPDDIPPAAQAVPLRRLRGDRNIPGHHDRDAGATRQAGLYLGTFGGGVLSLGNQACRIRQCLSGAGEIHAPSCVACPTGSRTPIACRSFILTHTGRPICRCPRRSTSSSPFFRHFVIMVDDFKHPTFNYGYDQL